MAIDPSIPLQALRGMYNPADTVRQVASLRDIAQQQQMRGLQIQEAMDQRQRAGRLRDLLAGAANPETGQVDYRKARAAYAEVGDIEGAASVDEIIAKMDDRERARVKDRISMLGAAAQSLRSLPYEQRRAALMEMAPALEPLGMTADQLQAFDPTDAAIDGFTSQVLGVKGVLEQQNKDRSHDLDVRRLDETRRHNEVTEGISRGQLDVAQGNLNVRRDLAQRAGQPSTAQARRDEVSLRKEFNNLPDVKAFNDVRQSYRTIEQISKNPSAANDLALIFSYMKMLDPGSVVREGEFANAQNAAGVPDRIRNMYNKAISGERLNQDQREEFLASAGDVYRSRVGRFNQLAEQYRSYANDYGANPDRVAVPEGLSQASGKGGTTGGGRPAQVQSLYDEFGLED